jgi:hypothetical protein
MVTMSVCIDAAKVAPTAPTTNSKATSKPETAGPNADTATISSPAQAAATAALQEATETVAQTTKEATAGDHQAQRLLARYAAAARAQ